jgi:hypothetical protein
MHLKSVQKSCSREPKEALWKLLLVNNSFFETTQKGRKIDFQIKARWKISPLRPNNKSHQSNVPKEKKLNWEEEKQQTCSIILSRKMQLPEARDAGQRAQKLSPKSFFLFLSVSFNRVALSFDRSKKSN